MTPLIDGVQVRHLDLLADERGSFVEAYRSSWFPTLPPVVQANVSRSRRGVIRGLHVHRHQWDVWVPLTGRLFVALADLRSDLEAPPVWTHELDAGRPSAIAIPPGVAHGFQALEDASLLYGVTRPYDGTDELGFDPLDPTVGVEWPFGPAVLSDRDRSAPSLGVFRAQN